jgi:hypothetical protein
MTKIQQKHVCLGGGGEKGVYKRINIEVYTDPFSEYKTTGTWDKYLYILNFLRTVLTQLHKP